jgi:hypothetical protein
VRPINPFNLARGFRTDDKQEQTITYVHRQSLVFGQLSYPLCMFLLCPVLCFFFLTLLAFTSIPTHRLGLRYRLLLLHSLIHDFVRSFAFYRNMRTTSRSTWRVSFNHRTPTLGGSSMQSTGHSFSYPASSWVPAYSSRSRSAEACGGTTMS